MGMRDTETVRFSAVVNSLFRKSEQRAGAGRLQMPAKPQQRQTRCHPFIKLGI